MARDWLSDIRKNKGYTHEQVAEQIGITRQYYGMIENGDRDPSVEVAMKLARILGFKWAIFFETDSNKTLRLVQS